MIAQDLIHLNNKLFYKVFVSPFFCLLDNHDVSLLILKLRHKLHKDNLMCTL